jgi:hypothetical protein
MKHLYLRFFWLRNRVNLSVIAMRFCDRFILQCLSVWPSQVEVRPTWVSLRCLHSCHAGAVAAHARPAEHTGARNPVHLRPVGRSPRLGAPHGRPTPRLGALRQLKMHVPAVQQFWITRSDESPASDAHLAHATACVNGLCDGLDNLLLSGLNQPGVVRKVTVAMDCLGTGLQRVWAAHDWA